ncbi:hypothetical protein F5X96DRAFT_628604 [Biscogniauxia mediterranea]|nr:hypothetical protein F5X96DRAFT_628604 [Biscogniauxia mediterranea]
MLMTRGMSTLLGNLTAYVCLGVLLQSDSTACIGLTPILKSVTGGSRAGLRGDGVHVEIIHSSFKGCYKNTV